MKVSFDGKVYRILEYRQLPFLKVSGLPTIDLDKSIWPLQQEYCHSNLSHHIAETRHMGMAKQIASKGPPVLRIKISSYSPSL